MLLLLKYEYTKAILNNPAVITRNFSGLRPAFTSSFFSRLSPFSTTIFNICNSRVKVPKTTIPRNQRNTRCRVFSITSVAEKARNIAVLMTGKAPAPNFNSRDRPQVFHFVLSFIFNFLKLFLFLQSSRMLIIR